MELIDISMDLATTMPRFPGDPEFHLEAVHAIARGDGYNLSEVRMGTHAGTHVDPPLHFFPGGIPTDGLDLSTLNGPCEVVQVPDDVARIRISDLGRVPAGSERILFRTRNSERWSHEAGFFPDYVALDISAADELAARGVRLVGIDALSVESDPAGRYPVHHALLGRGVLILEGLRLAGVAPGQYELRCLPLKLRGGDGGPARAALVAP